MTARRGTRIPVCRPGGARCRREQKEETMRFGAVAAITLAVAIAPATPATDPNGTGADAEKAAIARVIDDSIGWATTKNVDLLLSTVAHDADFFIFHPDSKSTVRGFDAFKQLIPSWLSPDFVATRHEIRDLAITRSRSGEVAWFSAILDDLAEIKGKPAGWRDTRWTGVLEKREGRWVIVQMHFSFASDVVAAEARAAAARHPSKTGS
jgi:hypothetical protein